jgi:alpha-galactosidase
VGVVNLGSFANTVSIQASDLGLTGTIKMARDLWTHQDVRFKDGSYAAQIPSHGVLLLQVSAR